MGPRDDEQKATPQEDSWSETLHHNAPAEDEHIPPAERVEQYVQLHEHIERLRQDRRPDPPSEGMPEEARTYQMAALFRAAAPDAAEPDPAFVKSLAQRLDAQRAQQSRRGLFGRERRGFSRRTILGTGAAAAAAALVGAAAGAFVESNASSTPPSSTIALVPEGEGIWVPVAQADAIPVGGVLRFNTDFIVGFIRHTSEGFTALSGACTHMGCLLMWNNTERTFDCPCHGGRFAENGASASSSPVRYRPLPTIKTRIDSGQVWVYVVPPSSGAPQPQRTPTHYGVDQLG